MEIQELRMLQALPLDVKILKTQQRIREWYDYWNGMVYVAFSGGKDSTALLHIVRGLYPEVQAMFVDTGLEYPEIREFVKNMDNVVWMKPKVSFKQVIDNYGYPIVSKKIAKAIRRLQNPSEKNIASRNLALTGITKDGRISKLYKLPEKWKYLIDAPFKISEQCCYYMKHEPAHRYEKMTGKHSYIGTMASDSQIRESKYLQTGCNNFNERGNSAPMGFWTEKDVWDYIKLYDVPYSRIYDMGEKRTGCIFCGFGVCEESKHGCNRFQRMQTTHPQLYDYCMNKLKLSEVLDYINIPYISDVENKIDGTGKTYQQYKII